MLEPGTIHATDGDEGILTSLRAGDDSAFLSLVERHQAAMLRIARCFVPSSSLAEDVVQEAWLGVLKGLPAFEGRSSLKAWIFRIVANIGKTRGVQEARTTPFSAAADEGDGEPAVDPGRFLDDAHPRWPGHWQRAPQPWADEQLIAAETIDRIRKAIETLPPTQRRVITLRDVEGVESEEVCAILGISEGNQRVLLHRARSRVRAILESHLDERGGRS